MQKLAVAIAITAEAFKTKLDKGGQPYILHCLRVMNNTNGDECTKCVAVMHDLIEDTDYTFDKLLQLGFSGKIVALIKLLTHDRSVTYTDYIASISTSINATRIKLVDLEDNMNITRLQRLTEKDLKRIAKYHEAYCYLKRFA
jgi:(p)ppGpp synthase/HD superfamily hydrolase